MPKSRLLTLAVLTVLIALAGGLLLGRISGNRPSASAAPLAQPVPTTSTTAPADEPAPAPAAATPAPQPAPAPQPQPQPKAGPGVLEVLPNQIALPEGQWTAQFTVANVGDSDSAWFAVGIDPAIKLSATKGVLGPGAETVVTATVDHTKLAKGPFSLDLHVSANDTAESVTLTGTKQVKVAIPPGPGDLKAA